MSFQRPTLQQIIDRVKGDFRTELGIPTVLRRSFEMVMTRAIAGVAHLLYGFLEYIAKQVFVDTAEVENLERHAAIYGLQRKAATFEQFTLKFTGLAGSTIPAGSEVQRSDAALYTTDSVASIPTFVAGVAQVTKFTTIADVSGSLNSKYFLYDTPENSYVFFMNINAAGVDPVISGRTSVSVPAATNANANAIAAALQTAMNAQSDITAIVSTNEVTATNDDTGAVDTAADGAAPTGFGILLLTTGVTQVDLEVVVPCTASASGTDSSVMVDDLLSLSSPISGIDSDCTVVEITDEADDTESDAALRARVLARIQQPPLGGSASDYIQETLKIAGVVRAWVFPQWLGENSVGVSFILDDEDDMIPDSLKLDEVEEALEEFRPVTVALTVFAPVAYPINPQINISPNNATVRAAIEAELNDLLMREGEMRGSYKSFEQTNTGTILLSRINEAISVAAGEVDHALVSPVADVTPNADGKLVTLGTITWGTL